MNDRDLLCFTVFNELCYLHFMIFGKKIVLKAVSKIFFFLLYRIASKAKSTSYSFLFRHFFLIDP